MITTVVVCWQSFLLKKWAKVRINFFLFDSEFASSIISISDSNQKVEKFHSVMPFYPILTVLKTF
jgi:hypothetical protein